MERMGHGEYSHLPKNGQGHEYQHLMKVTKNNNWIKVIFNEIGRLFK